MKRLREDIESLGERARKYYRRKDRDSGKSSDAYKFLPISMSAEVRTTAARSSERLSFGNTHLSKGTTVLPLSFKLNLVSHF